MARKRKPLETFSQRVLALISEPDFIRFENILREPNFFRIVGRAHYERWHSAFWGWLLDPKGSHIVSDYVLKRLLLLLIDHRTLPGTDVVKTSLLPHLPTIEFTKIDVAPTEYYPTETSVQGVGRFDIFLTADFNDSVGSGRLNLLCELKIDSKPDLEQSRRYANWLETTHPKDINVLVFLIPKLGVNSDQTVGDPRWYCVNYQLLNDKLLSPLLDRSP